MTSGAMDEVNGYTRGASPTTKGQKQTKNKKEAPKFAYVIFFL